MRLTYPTRLLLIVCLLVLLAGAALAQEDNTVLPITQDVNYTVQPADTVESIGALFDVSPTCLAEMNELDKNNTIFVGDVLLISVACPLYGADARDEGGITVTVHREVVTYEEQCTGYIVQKLDTLDVIGQALNVSAISLQIENNIAKPTDLFVGQCLTVPEDAPPYGQVPALDLPSDVDPSLGQGGALVPGETYVVQPGDTLDVLAQEKNVSIVSLLLANRLVEGRRIQPGMTLVIPDDAPPYGTYPAITPANQPDEVYFVVAGDTLDSIAEQFDVAVLALQLANEFDSDADIFPGRAIIIPANVPGFGEDDAMLGQGGGAGGAEQVHVIQPLETIDVIAAFYNKNRECILKINEIDRPAQIKPGQVITIPDECGPYVGDFIAPLNLSVSPVDDTAADDTATDNTDDSGSSDTTTDNAEDDTSGE